MKTEAEFLAYLQRQVDREGSVNGAAKMWGMSQAYLRYVLLGERPPGPKILDAVGYERVVGYQPKDVHKRIRDAAKQS